MLTSLPNGFRNSPPMADANQRIVVLTEGHSDPVTAKTGASVIRYRESEVVAVLDAQHAGKMAVEILGVGARIPVIATLAEASDADTLLIGTAPTGGRMPSSWRAWVAEALRRGMNVVSGLHDFLGDDPEFERIASESGALITDVRRNSECHVSKGQPLGDRCLRVHTVGHDCSIGKMLVTVEVDRALREQGHDSKFLATGQTGIMVAGDGVPIDCVVGDFVSGAAERLVVRNQQHRILMVEGQGSLAHPMYSAVTLGLLHGCQPHGLIMCYEAGRVEYGGIPGRRLRSLSELCKAYELVAGLVQPTRVIGVAMNGRLLSEQEAEREKGRVRELLGLPVCDVIRDGPGELVQAVIDLQASVLS